MMHDMSPPMIVMWSLFGLLMIGIAVLVYFFSRPERAASRPVAEFDIARRDQLLPVEASAANKGLSAGARAG